MNTPPSSSANSSPSSKSPRPRRWSKTIPWLIGIGLISLIVAGLWPKAQPVEIATISRGAMTVTIDEEGKTRVKNRYVISSPVAGLLRRIDWKPGAEVVAGKTVMAVLETKAADLLDSRSQAQAEAKVRAAQAAFEQVAAQRQSVAATAKLALTDFSRITQLYQAGSVSKQEFEAAELRHTNAEQNSRAAGFALNVSEYELQQARALLMTGYQNNGNQVEPLVITSPVSGRVLRVFQESERVVSAGMPLLEVGDPTDIEARIEVLSRDAVGILPGARTELLKWGGDKALTGRVRLIEPAAFTKISALGVEEQRVNVMVDILDPLSNRPTLGDEYRVDARIVTWESSDVLKSPAGALFQNGDDWETYVLEHGVARLQKVQIGRSNGLETEIISGLQDGHQVVVYPGDKISDGVRVTPMVINTR
jgi:HlyD family secretion protein